MAEGFIDGRAVIGMPPEHRKYRWRAVDGDKVAAGVSPRIASSAIVEAFATIDSGLFGATSVGERTFVMKHAHIGHDAQVGDDCDIAPGVIVGGHVIIGNRVKVGLGASLRPRVIVGDDVVIGAGSVVVTSIPAGEKWAGNPARLLQTKEEQPSDRDLWEEWWLSWHGPPNAAREYFETMARE